MKNLKNKFNRWMRNRYGWDQLNTFLFAIAVIFYFCAVVYQKRALYNPGLFLLLLTLFRSYSRDRGRRRKENGYFLNLLKPLRGWKRRWRDRKDFRYIHCPSCNQTARVPKGAGKIKITCPHCHFVFERRV